MLETEFPNKLVDLHIAYVHPDYWVDRLNYANYSVISDTVSNGFVRVPNDLTIRNLRGQIEEQLGKDVFPSDFVFLKHIGRCLVLVRSKQESELTVDNFLPPNSLAPEIYILPKRPPLYGYNVLPPISPRPISRLTSPEFPDPLHPLETILSPKLSTSPRSNSDHSEKHQFEKVSFQDLHTEDHQEPQEPVSFLNDEMKNEEEVLDNPTPVPDPVEDSDSVEDSDNPIQDSGFQEPFTETVNLETESIQELPKKTRLSPKNSFEETFKLSPNKSLVEEPSHQTDTVSDLQNLSPDQMNSSFDDKLQDENLKEKPENIKTENNNFDKADLLEKLKKAQNERKIAEQRREDIMRSARANSMKLSQRRSEIRDIWKKKFFEEKKKTAPLDEVYTRLRLELESKKQKFLNGQKSRQRFSSRRSNQLPSLKNSNKIQANKIFHETEIISQKIESAKLKLTGEIKLRHQAEHDVKSLRQELLSKKIRAHIAYRDLERSRGFPNQNQQNFFFENSATKV